MTKACMLLCALAACGGRGDFFEFAWAFNCPDGTWFICRSEGYFHCESGPPTYDPPPPCTFVRARCSSDPRPGESEAQAACTPRPPACPAITEEAACLARADCTASYEGLDCTNPTGTMCRDGDTDCTCAEFVFVSCLTT